MPVHLGAMPFSVAAAIEEFPPEALEPGDGILLNDPFRGGAHLPDLTLVTPVFANSQGLANAETGRSSPTPRTVRTTRTSAGLVPAASPPTRRRSTRRGSESPRSSSTKGVKSTAQLWK
jgi:hypothetical protein